VAAQVNGHKRAIPFNKADLIRALVDKVCAQIQQLDNRTIDGSVTAQKYAAAFQSYCDQIKRDCM